MEEIVHYIVDHLDIGSHEAAIMLISALPITELRGGIPVGILMFDLHPLKTYLLCCLGNMIPIIPLLLFFDRIEALMQRHEFSNALMRWYLNSVRKRTATIERFEQWGLTLFVAIPLPVTGAWTGSVAAFLLGMNWKKAWISIVCGVLIAGVVVTVLTLGGYTFYSFLNPR